MDKLNYVLIKNCILSLVELSDYEKKMFFVYLLEIFIDLYIIL